MTKKMRKNRVKLLKSNMLYEWDVIWSEGTNELSPKMKIDNVSRESEWLHELDKLEDDDDKRITRTHRGDRDGIWYIEYYDEIDCRTVRLTWEDTGI